MTTGSSVREVLSGKASRLDRCVGRAQDEYFAALLIDHYDH